MRLKFPGELCRATWNMKWSDKLSRNYQDIRRHTKPNPVWYCTTADQELVYPTSSDVSHIWGSHSVYLQGIFDAILSDIHLCLQSSHAHSHGWRHLVDHAFFSNPHGTLRFLGTWVHLPISEVSPWWGSSAECMAKALAVSTSTPSGCWKASVYCGLWVTECESAYLILAAVVWHDFGICDANVSCVCFIHWWQKSRALLRHPQDGRPPSISSQSFSKYNKASSLRSMTRLAWQSLCHAWWIF